MHNYKELKVWQKARGFVKEVYQMTVNFPQQEQYGIVSQIRRASISISSNIAESSGKNSKKEFAYFLETAFASALEVENLIFLSFDLNYISDEVQQNELSKVTEIQKMLNSFINTLKKID